MRRHATFLWYLLLVSITITLTGCPRVKVNRLTNHDDTTAEGIRFYRPIPYLAVSHTESEPGKSEDMKTNFSIVWLPDMSQEYTIRASSGLGTVSYKPTLENGWKLTGLDVNLESKATDILTVVASLVPKPTGRATTPGGKELSPGMYRFIFMNGQIIGVDWEHPVFTVSPK